MNGMLYEGGENTDKDTIVIPTEKLYPGRYILTIALIEENEDCKNANKEKHVSDTVRIKSLITINYPKATVVQLNNHVMAVLNAPNNGGYEFVGFQWYRNDTIIEGATSAMYYSSQPFDPEAVYTVELTDVNGFKLRSCEVEQINDAQPDTNPNADPDSEPQEGNTNEENAPAQKMLRNNRMVISKDGQLFNIFGQKVR